MVNLPAPHILSTAIPHRGRTDEAVTPETLLNFTRLCAADVGTDTVLDAALPILQSAAGAAAVIHLRFTPGGTTAARTQGLELPDLALDAAPGSPTHAGLRTLTTPAAWAEQGVTEVAAHQLPGDAGVIVVAWRDRPAEDAATCADLLGVLDLAISRAVAEERLADLTARVDNAQQLANMGDYDWHIATDTNRWSDQLFRIYGHEPQSFNASYEKFLSHIHPDDRERITAIHQSAYASGEPYEMIERIVRPDGSVRYLASNGQVLRDDSGTPVRMRGTCIDITDRVRAEQEREQVGARFRSLVEASPDAILLLDGDRIVQANGRAGELLGGDPVGHPITVLLPAGPSAGLARPAAGIDGRRLQLDVLVERIEQGAGEAMSAVFLRDAEPRLRSEALAATLREVKVRRRQALEMNDNVVQALSAATYALEEGDPTECSFYLGRALAGARHLMNDWLNPPDGSDLQAGDLVRAAGSTMEAPDAGPGAPSPAPSPEEQPGQRQLARIVIVDDNEDLRRLLRLQIERLGRYDIVGEGIDGVNGVEVVAETQPDVVFLDLAMPRMDGLEALPLMLNAAPGVRVVVLSGFDQGSVASKALAAGAVRYIEKGIRINFAEVIDDALSLT
jgi:PAS domain S-box-containing protein